MKLTVDELFSLRPSRPPRGGRGLKFIAGLTQGLIEAVAPLAGGVD